MIQGILLAAGYGRRFDPGGRHNKLLATLPDGRSVAWHAARALCVALPGSVAVVRPQQDALAEVLRDAGCRLLVCREAEQGMGRALAHAVAACGEAEGWLVALADMPWIAPATLTAVAQAIAQPEDIAAAFFGGRRGHPVAFGRRHGSALAALQGDSGARTLLSQHPPHEVAAPDDGVLRDIDRPDDLLRAGR